MEYGGEEVRIKGSDGWAPGGTCWGDGAGDGYTWGCWQKSPFATANVTPYTLNPEHVM